MTLSRNFEFRASPNGAQRGSRFTLDTDDVVIGAPVIVKSGGPDLMGRLTVELATGAQDAPKSGMGGILVYEYAPVAYRGFDQSITTFSDLDFAPGGAAVQVVSGDDVIVAFTNTLQSDFLLRKNYPKARIMVAGVSIATPTLGVGDLLTPGVGDDTDGYWAKTTNDSEGWLTVVRVDPTIGLVEAQFCF